MFGGRSFATGLFASCNKSCGSVAAGQLIFAMAGETNGTGTKNGTETRSVTSVLD